MNSDLPQYRLIRSQRRTVSLQIDRNLQLIVRAPLLMHRKQIDDFVFSHMDWIKRNLADIRQRQLNDPPLSDERIELLKHKAKAVLPQKLAYYADIMGVHPTQLRITSAQTRFGSCSSNGHICFSWRLMLYPDSAIDYVVVHELAHLRHLDHSAAFYREVESVLPDWRERAALLKK